MKTLSCFYERPSPKPEENMDSEWWISKYNCTNYDDYDQTREIHSFDVSFISKNFHFIKMQDPEKRNNFNIICSDNFILGNYQLQKMNTVGPNSRVFISEDDNIACYLVDANLLDENEWNLLLPNIIFMKIEKDL